MKTFQAKPRHSILSLSLIGILLVAGCTSSQVDLALKATPIVSAFLEQYPNASISTVLVAQGTVAAQIEEIKKDCGPKFPLSSYYKTILIDSTSGTTLTVWTDSITYKVVCSLKTTAGGVPITTSTTATTIPPTTTTIPATTTTINATTTTTAAPMPDLEITPSDISDATYNSTSKAYKLSIVISNKGSTDSGLFNTSLIAYNSSILFNSLGYPPSYGYAIDGNGNSPNFQINNIPAGGQITKTFLFNFYDQGNKNNFMLNFSIDFQNQVSESNENNNFVSKNITVVTMPTTTTTGSTTTTTVPPTTTTSAGLPDLNVTPYVRINSNDYGIPYSQYLNFSINNIGTADAGPFWVRAVFYNESNYFRLNYGLDSRQRINGLAAGSSIYLTYNLTLCEGCLSGSDPFPINPSNKNRYFINITVDPYNSTLTPSNEIVESNENNNDNSTMFYWNLTVTRQAYLNLLNTYSTYRG